MDPEAPGLQGDRPRGSRGRLLRSWALAWSALLVPLFLGVTALTVALWATDPQYTETTPVTDLTFLVLGAMIAVGFVSQVRRRSPRIAGPVQSVLASLALSLTGAAGGRVEPAVGGQMLLLASLVLVALHRSRFRSAHLVGRPDLPSALLVLIAAGPLTVYATHLIGLARAAGPSCFLGQCARGDRFAEMAATSVAVLVLGALSAARPLGWRLPAWSAAVAALVLGSSSLVIADAPGALGTVGAVLTMLWGLAFVVATMRQPRVPRVRVPGP